LRKMSLDVSSTWSQAQECLADLVFSGPFL
jgi:hypothetical protein